MALPLEGLRVIELSVWIMGPTAGMILADMGAEVIKVEEPQVGDPSSCHPTEITWLPE